MKYIFVLIACLCVSCGGNITNLDYRTRDLIDSLTRHENEISSKELEKYCKDSFNVMVQKAVDSLLIVRQREMEETIGKHVGRDSSGVGY